MIIEQQAVDFIFKKILGYSSEEYFLCQTHSKEILTRNISRLHYKKDKNYLYATLYLCHTKKKCDKLILITIASIPEHKKTYLK